jgi:hypothetical protein
VIQYAADRLATATRRVDFVSGWVLYDGEAIHDVLPRALVDADRAAAGERPDRTVPTSLDLWNAAS